MVAYGNGSNRKVSTNHLPGYRFDSYLDINTLSDVNGWVTRLNWWQLGKTSTQSGSWMELFKFRGWTYFKSLNVGSNPTLTTRPFLVLCGKTWWPLYRLLLQHPNIKRVSWFESNRMDKQSGGWIGDRGTPLNDGWIQVWILSWLQRSF